ncbi:DNA polymerase III subunit delta [bacterium]|nr:DNA polymerase III subunit delta [bacterium]
MKLAGPKALAFCDRPPAAIRIALIHGDDRGLVAFAADRLARTWVPDGDEFDLVRMTEDDLRQDAGRLGDELCARSLLGGTRLVRLRIERETSAKPAIDALADIDAGKLFAESFWIVEAGSLGRTSKLRAAFEASARAAALHLFPDSEEAIAELIRTGLAEARVKIEPAAVGLLSFELAGDRRLALSELEKLSLFGEGLDRALSIDDVRALSATEQATGADDASDAALAGRHADAVRDLDRMLDAGGSPISALRTLHFRLMRMMDAVASNASQGMRLRPPVYERDWPAFQRSMARWSPRKVQAALEGLYRAEADCKQAGAPADAIVRTLFDRIAR